jgi:aspartyl-tRNA(Asn)/glutamyl-tRNA(Gln) amidotransferase subunit C
VAVSIRTEEVLRIAELAQLELGASEIETYRAQLDSILQYMSQLQQLDTSAVEPMTQVFAGEGAIFGAGKSEQAALDANPSLRDDLVASSTAGAEVLARAPEAAPPYFRVPKVIERS